LVELGRAKERYAFLRQTKRVRSLKEPSHSTWEDLHFLEVDSLDIVGQVYLGMVLGKFESAGLFEASVS
jgi:hypothetical protein